MTDMLIVSENAITPKTLNATFTKIFKDIIIQKYPNISESNVDNYIKVLFAALSKVYNISSWETFKNH